MKYGNVYWQNTELQNTSGVRAVNFGDCLQFMLIDYLYSQFLPEDYDLTLIAIQEMKTYRGEQLIIPLNWSLFDVNFMTGDRIDISEDVIPVFLAMTIESWSFRPDYFNEYNIAYLKRFEPIGCRDEYTKKVLLNYGVKAYLNGCFSAVLPKKEKKGNKILLIDAPYELQEYLPDWKEEAETFTQQFYFDASVPAQIILSKARKIYEYMTSEAKLIVTSRLHVASPCMAAGIPVIFAKRVVDARFSWLDKRMPLFGEEEFCKIQWNPESIEYEDDKKTIIQNALLRIQSMGKKNDLVDAVDRIYSMTERPEYPCFQSTIYSNYDKVIRFLEQNYSVADSFQYGLWGIGKGAENVYEYIRENYPNAILGTALDMYKSGEFHGKLIEKPTDYIKKGNEVIFVIPVQASNMAAEVLRKNGFSENEYVCAGDRFIQIKCPDFLI